MIRLYTTIANKDVCDPSIFAYKYWNDNLNSVTRIISAIYFILHSISYQLIIRKRHTDMPAAETVWWVPGRWMLIWCRSSCCEAAVQVETRHDILPQLGTSSSGGIKEMLVSNSIQYFNLVCVFFIL